MGVLWSVVATVRSGRRTFSPRWRRPSKACGDVTSCTRCRSMYSSAGAPGCSATTWLSRIFSMIVRGFIWRCATASPTSEVVAGDPLGFKSAVTRPEFKTDSTARFTAAASSFRPKLYSSIAATEPIAPNGLALFCPAISGAEPWTGSYSPTQAPDGFLVADGGRRQHPDGSGQNRAFITQDIAEHVFGDAAHRSGADSGSAAWRSCPPACDRARRRGTRRRLRSPPCARAAKFRCTFDLSTLVTFLRRLRAR